MLSDKELKRLLELAALQVDEKHLPKSDVKLSSYVSKYIDDLNIESGSDKVPCAVLYASYLEWMKQKYQNPSDALKDSSPTKFFRQLNRMYKSYNTRGERGFFLNGASFDLTIGNRFHSRMKKEHYEKNKKKQSKVPVS